MKLDNFMNLSTIRKINPSLAGPSAEYHGIMLDIANTGWTSTLASSAGLFGAFGGVVGAMSDDSSFLDGAVEGAGWGLAKGTASKILGQHYAAGSMINKTATIAEKNGQKLYSSVANSKGVFPDFKSSNFSDGWRNKQSVFGSSPNSFNSAFRSTSKTGTASDLGNSFKSSSNDMLVYNNFPKASKVPDGYYRDHKPSGFHFNQSNGTRSSIVSPINQTKSNPFGFNPNDPTITDIF